MQKLYAGAAAVESCAMLHSKLLSPTQLRGANDM